MYACLNLLAWVGLARAADPIALPVALAPYAGRSVAVGWAGEVHLVGRRAGWQLRKLVAGDDVAEIVYLRLDGDAWTEERIPPPPSLGASWGSDTFVDATVGLDGDGWPMIAFTQDWQPPGGDTQTSVFLARRRPDGWQTTELESFDGQLSSLSLATYGGEWCLAALLSSGGGFGVVRWGEGRGPAMWTRTGPLAASLALVEGGDEPQAVYRVLDDVYLLRADGTTQVIAHDAAWQLSAVASADGVRFLRYDPNRERPYAGVVGGAETEVDGKEAGWNNTAAVGPDGTALAAWYYRRNAFNKGVVVARLGDDGWETWTQIRDPKDNVGLDPTLSIGDDGTTALTALNRSTGRLEVRRYASVDEARAEAIPPAGDWTDRHRGMDLFAYGGGWYQTWRVTGGPGDDDVFVDGVSSAEGTLALPPALGLQGGLAGRIGRFDLALEYLKRYGGQLGETVDKLQNLAGKVGIDKFPFPGSRAQVHFHSVDLAGAYRKPDGAVIPSTLSERDLQVRYLGKADWYVGLDYRSVRSPQDVYKVTWGDEDQPDTVLAAWDTTARLGTTSVVVGRSEIDYLGRYEVAYLGPYFDVQAGCGYTAGRFAAGDETLRAGAFASGGRADAGAVAYRRFRGLQGAGIFVQAGIRGDVATSFTFPGDPGDTGLAFQRVDWRAGPFANAGAVF